MYPLEAVTSSEYFDIIVYVYEDKDGIFETHYEFY